MTEPIRMPKVLLLALATSGLGLRVGAAEPSPAPALAAQDSAAYSATPLTVPATGKTGFTRLWPENTGLTFTNTLSDEHAALNQIRLSGSGVAAGDIDGDGRCDLYFCALDGSNRLFRNLGGWRFEDITATAGVACEGQYSTGAALADLDGDGDLDLLVNGIGAGTRCFFNDGRGRFTEAAQAGFVRRFAAMSMALGDVDGDGDLDVYVANYRTTTVRSTGLELLNINGRRVLKPEDRDDMYITPTGFLREHGEPDFLYLNDGRGHFTPVPWDQGTFRDEQGRPLTGPPRDWGFSVMMRDWNGDGAPDLYVCNDFWTPDRFWLNDGRGGFQAAARQALPCTSSFSMGVDVADINRDGHEDFFVLDMLSPDPVRRMTQTSREELPPVGLGVPAERPQVERNTLFLSRGDGTYTELAQLSGVHATEWSWCPMFLDVDLDGYEDLLITCGYGFDTQDRDADNRINAQGPWPREKVPFKLLMYPRLPLPCVAFRNRGDLTFEPVSHAWGFDTVGYSHGMAAADLDGDGDLDLIVNHLNQAAGLYRNESAAPRVAVRLKGRPPNTRGIGAKVKVLRPSIAGGPPALQSQEIISGGRYLSSEDTVRVFAAGQAPATLSMEILWRSGRRSFLDAVQPNHLYEIQEPAPASGAPDSAASTSHSSPLTPHVSRPALFRDVSDRLAHTHHEELFDDYARQPLLPFRLSQPGPGVSWFDVDDDGWEDLIVGSGRGGRLAVFRNDQRGQFERLLTAPFTQPVTRDQTTVLGLHQAGGRTRLLAGSSNYEDGLALGGCVRTYDLARRVVVDELPGAVSSTGPLALGDVDADGDLDLFVGGRVVPGRYPEAASSRLFRNTGGQWQRDEETSKELEHVGLVQAALWADLTNDGWPELVLACHWGPIRLFVNDRGRLTDVTSAWGLAEQRGFWNSVTAGDFDGDGRLDLAAGNWGRNTKYQVRLQRPLQVYYGDLDGDGAVELIEAYEDAASGRVLPWRDLDSLALGLAFLRERFPTYRAFGEADVPALLRGYEERTSKLTVTTLDSQVLLNRGDHFETRPLPIEAQFAPVFGIAVNDFDGDGHDDLFVSQNFLPVEPMTSRYDGGAGLCLLNDGQAGFQALPATRSGIRIFGDGRGAATADFNADGRPDLAVGVNSGATRLFLNETGTPGLRVRLKGPPANPQGIGSVVRLRFAAGFGPARAVQAGSGYCSQESAVLVLGRPAVPEAIEVRWPGGTLTRGAVVPGAREIFVSATGEVRSIRE